MLVRTFRYGEVLKIGDSTIEIRKSRRGGVVDLVIDAPEEVRITHEKSPKPAVADHHKAGVT